MCVPKQPADSGNRLCEEGQALLMACILRGDRNAAIRTALTQAGHVPLTDQAIGAYRRRPQVREASALALAEIKDIGVVDLVRRLESLNDMAMELRRRMTRRTSVTVYCTLCDHVLRLFREISRLVDPLDLARDDRTPDTGPPPPQYTSLEIVVQAMEQLALQKQEMDEVRE